MNLYMFMHNINPSVLKDILLGHSQYIVWSTDPDRGFFPLSEEKNKKIKIYLLVVVGEYWLFSGDFDDFVIEILPTLQKIFKHFRMSEEKKKLECQLYFSCREQFQLV